MIKRRKFLSLLGSAAARHIATSWADLVTVFAARGPGESEVLRSADGALIADASSSMTEGLVAQLKRNAAACATAMNSSVLASDPLYCMTGRAAAEIERLQAENVRPRTALVEIRRLAIEEGKSNFARRAMQTLEGSDNEVTYQAGSHSWT